MVPEQLSYEGLAAETATTRVKLEALRTRSLTALSAGAIAFTLAKEQRLDGWLLGALLCLIVVGLLAAMILAPAPEAIPFSRLDPDSFFREDPEGTEDERVTYRDAYYKLLPGYEENKLSFTYRSFCYLGIVSLLVIEIALIGAHFTASSMPFTLAILIVTSVCLVGLLGYLLPKDLPILQADRHRNRGDTERVELPPLPQPPPIPGAGLPALPPESDLDKAIRTETDIEGAFRHAKVLVLGQPAGKELPDGRHEESEIVHFYDEELPPPDGEKPAFVPVFTRPELMRGALLKKPDWQTLSILEVDGNGLLNNLSSDARVILNPWSKNGDRGGIILQPSPASLAKRKKVTPSPRKRAVKRRTTPRKQAPRKGKRAGK